VPGNDYKAFLRSHLGADEFHPGGIYDLGGNFLGEHGGIEMFTIGQRKGLPGGSPQPRYVVDLDPATNRVIVGSVEDLVSDDFEIDQVNWIARRDSDEPLEVTVKIRYSHPGTAAIVTPLENGRARIALREPQKAVTPGQAAVIYDGDRVLGGGWICRAAALQPA
jgi:tRNA-specific 2-thiouridylase